MKRVLPSIAAFVMSTACWFPEAKPIVFDQRFVGAEKRKQKPFAALWGHTAPYTDLEGEKRKGLCVWEANCTDANSWDLLTSFKEHLDVAMVGSQELTSHYLDLEFFDDEVKSLMDNWYIRAYYGQALGIVGGVTAGVTSLVFPGPWLPIGVGGSVWSFKKVYDNWVSSEDLEVFYKMVRLRRAFHEYLLLDTELEASKIIYSLFKKALKKAHQTQEGTRGYFSQPCPPTTDLFPKLLESSPNQLLQDVF